ncbi:hypothetical protein [Kitasatospora sp. NBC_01300]|uniref:hypothetical protein n=1 Tax=Kitasatospora sp. NBC_01300 TaxID=2903574 RepID=UPI00352CA14F|nr:hypothetical protein OG556_18400 [Kitasatospora sp. NBC_01300]
MTAKPTTATYTKRPAGDQPQTLHEQQASARMLAEKIGALSAEHDTAEALAVLRRARQEVAAGLPVDAWLVPLVFEAYLDGRLSAETIAAELTLTESQVQAVLDSHVLIVSRVDLQTPAGWDSSDCDEVELVELVDDDVHRTAEQFAQTTLDEVLADYTTDAKVAAARVLVWIKRPGRDADAVATAERARA